MENGTLKGVPQAWKQTIGEGAEYDQENEKAINPNLIAKSEKGKS